LRANRNLIVAFVDKDFHIRATMNYGSRPSIDLSGQNVIEFHSSENTDIICKKIQAAIEDGHYSAHVCPFHFKQSIFLQNYRIMPFNANLALLIAKRLF
jgi:hypothetical protein